MGLGSGNNKLSTCYNEFYQCASSNTGNLLFNYALETLVSLAGTDVRWSTPAEKINAEGHSLLIPMANNIGAHTDLGKSGPKLSGVNVHKTVMGLGAQFQLNQDFEEAFAKIPSSSKQWLIDLCNSSSVPNVSVRGKLTHKVFEKLGVGNKAIPLGCPSHFLSSDKLLGTTISKRVALLDASNFRHGVAVTAGNPAIANLGKLEQFLISTINCFGGKYIVQHPKDLICLTEGWYSELTDEEIANVSRMFFHDAPVDTMKYWFKRFAITYRSIPQWYSDISKYDIVVGTRIHGCQIGLQAGVPSICLHIDSRTKELCETMHIPTLPAKEFQKAPSMALIVDTLKKWDWEFYDQNRHQLARQTFEFVKQNGLSPSEHFSALVAGGESLIQA